MVKISYIYNSAAAGVKEKKSTVARLAMSLVPKLEELGANVNIFDLNTEDIDLAGQQVVWDGEDGQSPNTVVPFGYLRKGASAWRNSIDFAEEADIILSMQGVDNPALSSLIEGYKDKKAIVYVWDMYPWMSFADGRCGYLNQCHEVWCSSVGTMLRTHEIYGVPQERMKVIRPWFEPFDAPKEAPPENMPERFIYHPLRNYEQDSCTGWIYHSCDELNGEDESDRDFTYSIVKSEHGLPFEEYKHYILNCEFLASEYAESSTGGLSLLEGYYHGKDVLISDSKFSGAREIFQDRGVYFRGDYREDLKAQIKHLYNRDKPEIDIKERRKFCERYLIDNVSKEIFENIKRVTSS